MDLKTAIQKYRDLDFEIVLLKPNTKKSSFYGSISHLYDDTTNQNSIEIAVAKNLNIGLRMSLIGPDSGMSPGATYLFALDFDDPALYDEWKAANPHLANTPTQKSPHGYHVLLTSPCSYVGATSERLSIIGQGWYLAVEPSTTPDGQYQWLLSPWDTPIAHIADLRDLNIPESIWLELDWETRDYNDPVRYEEDFDPIPRDIDDYPDDEDDDDGDEEVFPEAGLSFRLEVTTFAQMRDIIKLCVKAGIARCLSPNRQALCSNPAVTTFWQDHAEWYNCCEEHLPDGPQWTGSTRFTPHLLDLPVLPLPALDWLAEQPYKPWRDKIKLEKYTREP